MKNRIPIYILLALSVLSCQDPAPSAQDFPILLTLEPSNIDETGATFRGEVLREGLLETNSYGFVWGKLRPTLESASITSLGKSPSKGIFEARVDSGILNGETYYIRAFASFPDKNVYGDVISMVGGGSIKDVAVVRIENFTTGAFATPYASMTTEKGSLLFPNSEMVYFDPESNTFSEGPLFPDPPRTDRRFGSVSIGNTQYFVNTQNNNLYRLENDNWTLLTQTPINFFSKFFYFLHATGNKIYILGIAGFVDSYVYDLENNTWSSISGIPVDNSGIVSGSFSMGEVAYALTKDKRFWKYIPATDTWTQLSTFPGETKGTLISTKDSDKLYIGFSFAKTGERFDWKDRRFYAYDSVNDSWRQTGINIIYPERGKLYYFTLKERLYIGNINGESHTMWYYGL